MRGSLSANRRREARRFTKPDRQEKSREQPLTAAVLIYAYSANLDQVIVRGPSAPTFAFPITAAVSPILCLGALAGSWATHLRPDVLIIVPLSLCAALAIRTGASIFAPSVTWLPAAAEGGFQICSIGLALACLSYVGAKTGFPLRDAKIAAIDAHLGFHWPIFAHWIDHHSALLALLNASYATFTAQLILTAVALFVFKRYDELDRYFLTFICASLLAEVLSSLAPTLGPAASLASGVLFAHVHMIGRTTAEILLALRNGGLTTIDLRSLDGIISFPSLHVAVSILIPFFLRWNRALFWPAVALNLLMLISAIPSGNHYLLDVLGGLGVAVVSIALLNTRATALSTQPRHVAERYAEVRPT